MNKLIVNFLLVGLYLSSGFTFAKDNLIKGVITNYYCGDNCYLVVLTDAKAEITGLCEAPECAKWNEVANMPDDMKGKKVSLEMGKGTAVDGSDNAMAEMQSFKKIKFLTK